MPDLEANRLLIAFPFRGRPGYNPARARHGHEHHELLYCTEGRGTQLTDRGEERCAAGELFFFPAGSGHQSYAYPGQDFRAVVVSLDERLFAGPGEADRQCLSVLGQMKRAAEERARVPLSPAGSAEVGRQLAAMLAEFTSRRPGQDCAVKARMMDVLAAVLRDGESRLGPDAPLGPLSRRAMIGEALWYLRLNFMNPVRVADVLRFCPMSRSHFHAVFREVTGQTLVAALRAIRVERAKELLAGTDLGILEISLQCGFGSLSHFCHTFRALAGGPPREWRAEHCGTKPNE